MKSILLKSDENQSQSIKTYFQKPDQDFFIAQINANLENESVELFQYWWDALYDQFFIKFNDYLEGYNFSYTGEQYNDRIGLIKLETPVSGLSNMSITKENRFYFYPKQTSHIPNLNYSKKTSNCYLKLSDCSIFNGEGGSMPVFCFDLHVKTLQKTSNYHQQIALLSSIDMLPLIL